MTSSNTPDTNAAINEAGRVPAFWVLPLYIRKPSTSAFLLAFREEERIANLQSHNGVVKSAVFAAAPRDRDALFNSQHVNLSVEEEKSPHTGKPCLSCAAGRTLRLALGLPAVGCQRVVGGKHLGRGFFGLCRDPGFLGFTVDRFLKPDPASVVRHQRPKL